MKIFKPLYAIIILLIFSSCIFLSSKKGTELTATLELDQKAKLGEGAIWHDKLNKLLWIDIKGHLLHIFDPSSSNNTSIDCKKRIGTVVPVDETYVLVALEDGIYKLNVKTEEFKFMVKPAEHLQNQRFNDGKCDPAGRFWVGSMSLEDEKQKSFLYCIENDYSTSVKVDKVTISNGIVWSLDKKKMYYIDTPTRQVKEYNYDDQTGEISFIKIAVEIPDSLGFPDGSTIDENGNIWIAMWGGSCVTCWDPQTGELLQKINVPAQNITSCAFGGEELDILYITTASVGMDDKSKNRYPKAGGLFSVKPGARGVKAYYFNEN